MIPIRTGLSLRAQRGPALGRTMAHEASHETFRLGRAHCVRGGGVDDARGWRGGADARFVAGLRALETPVDRALELPCFSEVQLAVGTSSVFEKLLNDPGHRSACPSRSSGRAG